MASREAEIFSMGGQSLKINRLQLHGTIRRRVAKLMKEAVSAQQQGLILLKGGGAFQIHDTDTEGIFRQESYFHYMFGVTEEDFYGAVDLQTDPPKAVLFMPRLPDSYAVYMGQIEGPADKKQRYAVDEVHYVDEMPQIISKLSPAAIHVLEGSNTDSGVASTPAAFDGIDKFAIDRMHLFPVLQSARTVKTQEELDIMRYASKVASAAHVQVMQQIKPGMMEFEVEAIFLGHAYRHGGCRHAPYTPICASGANGAVLHYGHAGAPNDCEMEDGSMMVLDMGSEYYAYDSDITCSYPVNGHFTEDQRTVYEAVLSAQQAVIKALKPGVSWPVRPYQYFDRLAEHCILSGLKKGGLVQGNTDAAVQDRIGALFMPHGLGHLLGIDTHDVGGYTDRTPPRIDEPGLRSLRTARVLEEGMVITVEPGCYFNPLLLKPAYRNPAQAKYLNQERLQACMNFGGVRIEDDVIITASGAESMTDVPRSVQDIEAVMAGGSWPR